MTEAKVPSAAELLELEVIGMDRFRARYNLDNYAGSTFGGQAICQALAAARKTVPDWPANNISGHFLRAGLIDQPMQLVVERVNDGRRFATRRVSISQGDRRIFEALCSFHDEGAGVRHQFVDVGALPAPEDLLNLRELVIANRQRFPSLSAEIFTKPFPIELRLLDPARYFEQPGPHSRDFWFRIPSADRVSQPGDHQALLALMSDYWLPGVIGGPHSASRSIQGLLSLNESLWFHRPVRTDEWLLYRTESHWADHGRGLSRGLMFSRDGRLVATVAQEALLLLGAEAT